MTSATVAGMQRSADRRSVLTPRRSTLPRGRPTVDVYVSSDYGSGYIELAGDGTVKQLNYPS